jgi:hypothetical protein
MRRKPAGEAPDREAADACRREALLTDAAESAPQVTSGGGPTCLVLDLLTGSAHKDKRQRTNGERTRL